MGGWTGSHGRRRRPKTWAGRGWTGLRPVRPALDGAQIGALHDDIAVISVFVLAGWLSDICSSFRRLEDVRSDRAQCEPFSFWSIATVQTTRHEHIQ